MFIDLTAKHVKVGLPMTLHAAKSTIVIFYTIVFICGTVGNALVIRNYASSSTSGQNGAKFVIVLAIIDLISSVWVPFVEVNKILFFRPYVRIIETYSHWPYGKIPCYVLHGSFNMMFFASAWLLVAIGIERMR